MARLSRISTRLPALGCAALLVSPLACSEDSSQITVDAVGCEVSISTRYHVTPGRDGLTFEIPHEFGTRIWIGPLIQHSDKPLDSVYRGALKVEHHAPGCMAISSSPWVSVQGLHQEVDLIGVSDQEVTHVIEHCNATMNPEAVAVAARLAKGCAAVLPTDKAAEALLGKKITYTPEAELIKGRKRPLLVTSWAIIQPELSSNLASQGVQRGARITSVCGVPVSEIEEGGKTLCCGTAVTDHIDATIVEDGKSRTITGSLPSNSSEQLAAQRPGAATGCGR